MLGPATTQDPDSKVHGANIGPNWGLQVPGGPHVVPMNLAVWGIMPQAQRVRDRVANYGFCGQTLLSLYSTTII